MKQTYTKTTVRLPSILVKQAKAKANDYDMSFQEALSSALEAWLKQSQTSTKLSLPKAKLGIDWQKPLSREDIYEHINGDLSR